MANSATGKDGWHNAYLHARQIETEVALPEGSVKPELSGRYSLVLANLTEDQIRQMAHLWYVLSHTAIPGASPKSHAPGKSAS